jgi:hypothetical protein
MCRGTEAEESQRDGRTVGTTALPSRIRLKIVSYQALDDALTNR